MEGLPEIYRDVKWIIDEGRLRLSFQNSLIDVSAEDIVRIEHKNQDSYKGILLRNKPSEDNPHLCVNRFMAKVYLLMYFPKSKRTLPYIELIIATTWNKKAIDKLPTGDQIIIDDEWFPVFFDNIETVKHTIQKFNINLDGNISFKDAIQMAQERPEFLEIEYNNQDDIKPDVDQSDYQDLASELKNIGFSAKLYSYQRSGLEWLNFMTGQGLGCILADEMGLGKTLQIMALLTLYKNRWQKPSLVIAPATILENWRREFIFFSPQISTIIHSGHSRTGFPSRLKSYDVILTSFDTVVRDHGMLGMIDWGFIIVDEAQAIKNPETHRARAVKSLKRNISIAVTGTPVQNSLKDLWSIMDFTCPGILGERKSFEALFSDSLESAVFIEKIVSPMILRRLVSDVAQDLPERIIINQAISIKDNEIQEYELIRKKTIEDYGRVGSLVALGKLRQYCCHPFILESDIISENPQISSKYERLIEIADEIIANRQKVIIFTSYQKMSDIITTDLSKRFQVPSWLIDGRTPITKRQIIVDEYSDFKGPAFLILNPNAAGTGLNITAANHVIHYNLEWNPAVEDQATARAYRRGQTLPVTVHRLFYPGTLEEVIIDRLERKRNLAETAIVGNDGNLNNESDIARALEISPFINK
jgi:SNF2 family DNA or RNA helicase